MGRPTVILHKGMRTGGTALVSALSGLADYRVLHDPLHDLMRDVKKNRSFTSSDWASHHPPGFRYLAGYDDLVINGELQGWEDRFADLRILENHEPDEGLERYLRGLEQAVREKSLTPIFAFHDAEGLWDELIRIFPDAFHLSLSRDDEAEYTSWLTQLSYGNPFFFEHGRRLATMHGWAPHDDGADGDVLQLDESVLRAIHSAYAQHVVAPRIARAHCDLQLELLTSASGEEAFVAGLTSCGLTDAEAGQVMRTLHERPASDGSGQAVRQRLSVIRDFARTAQAAKTESLSLMGEQSALRAEFERLAEEQARSMEEVTAELLRQRDASHEQLRCCEEERQRLAFELMRLRSRRSVRTALACVRLISRLRWTRTRPARQEVPHEAAR